MSRVVAVARALYAFQGEQAEDLSFREDDIVHILKKVCYYFSSVSIYLG